MEHAPILPVISHCALFMAAALAASAAACAEAAQGAVKSAYVAVLEPGRAFAPVADAAGAGIEPLVDTQEVFPAAYVEDFAVDGDMGKPVWRNARSVPAPMRRGGEEEMPFKSDIRLLYSQTALYVGATLWQDMSQMTAKWDQRDQAVWNDDNIEVFLFVPGDNGNRLCQFVLNPLDTLADLRDGDKSWWARGTRHAVRRFDDRWTLELKIPFEGLGMERPLAGDFIGARFCRTVHAPANAAGASPALLSPGHTQRARFAKLLFAAPEGPDAERLAAEGEAYRRETVRRRFHRRYGECRARFEEVRGCATSFASSAHPLHQEAWGGIRQMEEAVAAFESRFAKELAAGGDIPAADAAAILAEFAGFEAFASKYAYAVWLGDPWARGSQADLPPEDALPMPRPLHFEQAGNEREQFCLNIAGLLCGSRLDLRIHPQSVERTKERPFLSTDAFEIYQEPFIRFGSEVITAPLVRAAGNVVTVSPGQTVRVWVVFNSRGVPPGDYATRISFKSASDLRVADRDLAVAAKVWNFALPETRDWPIKCFFWGPFSFAEDEVALLELMHDHHVTHGWTQKHRYQYGLYDDRGWYRKPGMGKGTVDKSHDFEDNLALHGNEAFLRRARELGMRFVVGWGTPTSVDWFKTFTGRLLDMGFDYDDFVFHGLLHDEFSKRMIPLLASEREAIHNWNTNLNFMATYLSTPPPTGATMDDIEAAGLPEFFKVWAVINGRCRDPKEGPDTIGRLKARGCKVWTYNCLQFMPRHQILGYYRFYPWDAFMRGLEGFAFWTAHGPNGDDGWDSRDGYDEGVCWRGLDKKPIPTKMFEAVREGLEDVAYMDRLEREIEQWQKRQLSTNDANVNDNSRAALIDNARMLLAEREEIVEARDQRRVDAWRLAVGRLIDAIVAPSK